MTKRRLEFGHGLVVRLGGPLVSAHLLLDAAGLTLIDTGLWGIARELPRASVRSEKTAGLVVAHAQLGAF